MKSVVITGGTIRIGKTIAEYLAARGWRVITVSHRADSGADVIADFTESAGAAKAYAEILKLLGGNPPDALVNNAALFRGTDEELEMVNFVSPQKLIMLMAGREEGRGAVVNILDAKEREGKYGETKDKLREYTFKAAAMFADTLRVNAVSPGPALVKDGIGEQAGECPLGRPVPEDIAGAVEYLLGAERVTGVDITVDGGAKATGNF